MFSSMKIHDIDVPVDEFLCHGGTMVKNFSRAEPDVQRYLFSSFGKNFEKTVCEIPDSELRSLIRIEKLGFLPLAVHFTIKDLFHNLFREDIDISIPATEKLFFSSSKKNSSIKASRKWRKLTENSRMRTVRVLATNVFLRKTRLN